MDRREVLKKFSTHIESEYIPDRSLLETSPYTGIMQIDDKGRIYTMATIRFPDIDGLIVDCWCYESQGILFDSAYLLEDGTMRLKHKWEGHKEEIITEFIPDSDGVNVYARLQSNDIDTDSEEYPDLNICMQLRRADRFKSDGKKSITYPEFISRCFIYTEKGFTYLDKTKRGAIPCREAEDPFNNPPYVQIYSTINKEIMKAKPGAWSEYSEDRYTIPVIGTVSRDKKSLVAIANGSAETLSQAWFDCLHNNSKWKPAENKAGKDWHVKIYAMENDSENLTNAIKRDFVLERQEDG